MDSPPTPRTAREYPGLLALCGLLWLLALLLAGFGMFIWFRAESPLAGLAVLVAVLMVLSGIGLYRLRRWGVILFGLLAGFGSVNHISRTLQNYRSISSSSPLGAFEALMSILGSIAIPIVFIYLVLLLWRRTR